MQNNNNIGVKEKKEENVSSLTEEKDVIVSELTKNGDLFFFSKKYFFWKTIILFLISFFTELYRLYFSNIKLPETFDFNFIFSFFFFFCLTLIFDFIYYLVTKTKTFKDYFFWKNVQNVVLIVYSFFVSRNDPRVTSHFFIMFSICLDFCLLDLICYGYYLLQKRKISEKEH